SPMTGVSGPRGCVRSTTLIRPALRSSINCLNTLANSALLSEPLVLLHGSGSHEFATNPTLAFQTGRCDPGRYLCVPERHRGRGRYQHNRLYDPIPASPMSSIPDSLALLTLVRTGRLPR